MNKLEKEGYEWAKYKSMELRYRAFVDYIEAVCDKPNEKDFDNGALKFLEEYKAKNMSESNEIVSMRQMAWERAKGELRSILCTYHNQGGNYEVLERAVESFIDRVEDKGMCE